MLRRVRLNIHETDTTVSCPYSHIRPDLIGDIIVSLHVPYLMITLHKPTIPAIFTKLQSNS